MVNGLFGSTAVAFKYKNGVLLFTDNGASYGRLACTNVTKIFKLTESCAVAFSGQIADIQFVKNFIVNEIVNDPLPIDPQGIHKLLQRLIYSKRSKLEILDISVVVCGVNKKENTLLDNTDIQGRFLGAINSKGNFWFDNSAATGIASHIILPILREYNVENLSKEEAIKFAEETFRVLLYKDCRASNSLHISICEENNVEILRPYKISTNWEISINQGEIVLQ